MFTINIIPQPAPRPRFSKFGTYNTSKYTNYKNAIKLLIANHDKYDEALTLTATFYMPIPRSTSNKKALALRGTPHIKKPDTDNMTKALLDAMNGVLFKDDSIVYRTNIQKIYSNNPRIEYQLKGD